MDNLLASIIVRPVREDEEARYRELMGLHHYLGDLVRIGHTLWYVATIGEDGEWAALIGFSASSLKCRARDEWIGWGYRHRYGRLDLIANNSRFLILPAWHRPNLGSRVLALTGHRIAGDWRERFGIPLVLLETFVDPARFTGAVYRAANWIPVGLTRGFRRIQGGYDPGGGSPKMVLLRPLIRDAREILSRPVLEPTLQTGVARMTLTADEMRTLPDFFRGIPDPRRAQGVRHPIHVVLAIAAAATLSGMRGYKAVASWAESLGQKARERFRCRRENGVHVVPSESIIRDVLVRVDPSALNAALARWNERFGGTDMALAIDGKTMCGAVDEDGVRAHIVSVVGHETAVCYTQKKSLASTTGTRSSAPMR